MKSLYAFRKKHLLSLIVIKKKKLANNTDLPWNNKRNRINDLRLRYMKKLGF